MSDINREYTNGETLLSLNSVNLSLGKGKSSRLILRDVDLCVDNIIRPGLKQGQVKGVLGPSGIGKTQLFKIISGALKHDPGEGVILNGTVLVGEKQLEPQPGNIGVVSQNYRVFNHMTVIDNLIFAGRQRGLTKAEAKAEAEDYLNLLGIYEQRDSWPETQISGGQRQRLATAQQVMAGHQFILMDEPFSGLDVTVKEQSEKLIARLVSDNELMTIIVVTHDIGAAIAVSDELWLMGRERDEESGEVIPGSRIVAKSDLIAEGLAWGPDIRHDARFAELESAIAGRFRTLT